MNQKTAEDLIRSLISQRDKYPNEEMFRGDLASLEAKLRLRLQDKDRSTANWLAASGKNLSAMVAK